jgi:hypothetical protein
MSQNVSGTDTEDRILGKIVTLQKQLTALRSKLAYKEKTIPPEWLLKPAPEGSSDRGSWSELSGRIKVVEHDLEVAQNQLHLIRLKPQHKKSGTKISTS